MMGKGALLLAGAAAILLAGAAGADAAEADAMMHNAAGKKIGTVKMVSTASGAVRIMVTLQDLPPGVHAIHVHETGTCEAPQFTSAGGHLAEGKAHGVESHEGPHPGDLPNLHVPQSGRIEVEYFNNQMSLAPGGDVFDQDGSAVIVHAKADDYKSQPSGDAGGRLACGVLKAAP